MNTVLVTGGAGFFGSLLKARLLAEGFQVVSVDLEPDEAKHAHLTTLRGDIRDAALMDKLFAEHRFETVYHCAAILAHAAKDRRFLWTCNADGTRIIAACAKKFGCKNLVFTSSNCLWGNSFASPIPEDTAPAPVEIYGLSKWEGEKILAEYAKDLNVIVIRCPTIIDEGRLGLLTILFDFIRENRKVWVVGGGANRYQFIYAADLIEACLRSAQFVGSRTFHIGSDDVKSFREVYNFVIQKAGSKSKVAALPRLPTILAMKLAYRLGLSPLGPYQYKMIAESFIFDTSRIKAELGWKPTLKNEDMLWLAYRYYADHYDEIHHRSDVSAHRQAAKMGIIRLLKWLS